MTQVTDLVVDLLVLAGGGLIAAQLLLLLAAPEFVECSVLKKD
jgi:hypothetical protein